MTKKECSRCRELKLLSMFYYRKERNSYRSKCKKCENELSREQSKTRDGLISSIYRHQKSHSKKRGHHEPYYSLNDLKWWISSQDNFEHIYTAWVESGYKKNLTPSIDRINDYKGYTLNNIRLTTWSDNKQKQHDDIKLGRSTSGKANCKPVLYGGIVYHSQAEAARKTGFSQQYISKACKDKNKSWEYA